MRKDTRNSELLDPYATATSKSRNLPIALPNNHIGPFGDLSPFLNLMENYNVSDENLKNLISSLLLPTSDITQQQGFSHDQDKWNRHRIPEDRTHKSQGRPLLNQNPQLEHRNHSMQLPLSNNPIQQLLQDLQAPKKPLHNQANPQMRAIEDLVQALQSKGIPGQPSSYPHISGLSQHPGSLNTVLQPNLALKHNLLPQHQQNPMLLQNSAPMQIPMHLQNPGTHFNPLLQPTPGSQFKPPMQPNTNLSVLHNLVKAIQTPNLQSNQLQGGLNQNRMPLNLGGNNMSYPPQQSHPMMPNPMNNTLNIVNPNTSQPIQNVLNLIHSLNQPLNK